jgi:alpha-tubulin suppressor-like RCC1 family protein
MKTYSNFILRRERKPKKIPVPEPIKKVVCGSNHTLALSVNGNVYGFGNNKYEQLSNDDEYKQGIIGVNKPTIFSPDKFKHMEIKDIAASGNCSFFVSFDKKNKTYYFYSAGEGLRGTLGQNLIKHISDIDLMPDISGLINENTMSPFEPMKLVCGNKHCLLLFRNPRILYVWGDNEYGELGTRDRLFYESPIPMLEEYNLPFKIMNISAGNYNSAFICEKLKNEEKKKLLRLDENKHEEEMSKIKKKRKKEKKEEQKKAEEESSSSYFNKLYNSIKKYI